MVVFIGFLITDDIVSIFIHNVKHILCKVFVIDFSGFLRYNTPR